MGKGKWINMCKPNVKMDGLTGRDGLMAGGDG